MKQELIMQAHKINNQLKSEIDLNGISRRVKELYIYHNMRLLDLYRLSLFQILIGYLFCVLA
jgi:hypothetical protein